MIPKLLHIIQLAPVIHFLFFIIILLFKSIIMDRNNTAVEVILKTHIVNHNTNNIPLAHNSLRTGVIERIGGEFLADLEVFTLDKGHHHAQNMVMAKHPMWENHVHNRIKIITYFWQYTLCQNLDKEKDKPSGPLDVLVIYFCNPFDIDDITIITRALPLEFLTNTKK